MAATKPEGNDSALGERLRDAVLSVYIRRNPEHTAPGWEELRDWSKQTWGAVAKELVAAGWTPPAGV